MMREIMIEKAANAARRLEAVEKAVADVFYGGSIPASGSQNQLEFRARVKAAVKLYVL